MSLVPKESFWPYFLKKIYYRFPEAITAFIYDIGTEHYISLCEDMEMCYGPEQMCAG